MADRPGILGIKSEAGPEENAFGHWKAGRTAVNRYLSKGVAAEVSPEEPRREPCDQRRVPVWERPLPAASNSQRRSQLQGVEWEAGRNECSH